MKSTDIQIPNIKFNRYIFQITNNILDKITSESSLNQNLRKNAKPTGKDGGNHSDHWRLKGIKLCDNLHADISLDLSQPKHQNPSVQADLRKAAPFANKNELSLTF